MVKTSQAHGTMRFLVILPHKGPHENVRTDTGLDHSGIEVSCEDGNNVTVLLVKASQNGSTLHDNRIRNNPVAVFKSQVKKKKIG